MHHVSLHSSLFTLRSIEDTDLPVLFAIYASSRETELAAATWWSEAEKRAFLRQQFDAQHRYYQEHYHPATFDLFEVDGQPAGRLYVARWENQTRIIDIAFLPAHRGNGTGTALIQSLLEESRQRGVPLTIHVERENPALAWYSRMGFQLVEDKGVYLFMQAL
jgi:ribosomal protein S18 acetylase RimI-like enzyme